MQQAKPALTLQTTTLWEYPSQHFGTTQQGSQSYIGATPSYVIWNLLQRYTKPGDRVVDPMCGSGTMLDVAQLLQREGLGFDVHPTREDVTVADARDLPLADASVDFWFTDPPYGDHLDYGPSPKCIGKLSAFDEAYFASLDKVLAEAHRVLRNRRYMAVYVGDFYQKKQGFVPIGSRVMAMMSQYFRLIDHVCVVRHNKSLKKGSWHRAAEEDNFFLRGFNHLIIGKKQDV